MFFNIDLVSLNDLTAAIAEHCPDETETYIKVCNGMVEVFQYWLLENELAKGRLSIFSSYDLELIEQVENELLYIKEPRNALYGRLIDSLLGL